ncbi:MAG TPA: hypothetical protein PKI11_17010 [Candidatus Hydrogenedentes bacterium]|nr:hypothetical protein [Candidatus Hydrogenedentota bacterium]
MNAQWAFFLIAFVGVGSWVYEAAAQDNRMAIADTMPDGFPRVAAVHALTQGPKVHFCNYYGIFPWDATGRYVVCIESDFDGREVRAEDTARVCLVDTETGELRALAVTRAWNFQQGALAHWLGTAPDREIIYNDCVDGAARSVILDVHSGERRELPRAVSAVAHDGKLAACISYARLNKTRPGYGYPGVHEATTDDPHPDNDGLYVMDLASGESRLIVTIDRVFRDRPPPEGRADDVMWFNHVLFNRDDTRIFFLARFKSPVGSLLSAAYTVNPDGSDLRCVVPYEWNNSHYDWRDAKQLMVTSRFQGGSKWLHVLFTDGATDHRPIAPDVLDRDGHCHFSPDGRWLVSDSYPQGPERMQRLFIGDMETEQVREVARFHQPDTFKRDWRCDLHPRWSRDGKRLCIDSTHEGTRQVYLVELAWPES